MKNNTDNRDLICIYNADDDFYGEIRFKCMLKDLNFLHVLIDKLARENGCCC